MERSRLHRPIVGLFVAVAMLAGCGGTQTAMTPSVAHQATSTSGDLIYTASSRSAMTVDIYTFSGSLVNTFTLPDSTHVSGMCSDTHGNVFVAAASKSPVNGYIYEYPHGAASPSATLTVQQNEIPRACSVDPNTGNLAVANEPPSGSNNDSDVAIFTGAQGSPVIYADSHFGDFSDVAYDNNSDLYVYYGASTILLELSNGSKTFTNVPISGVNQHDQMQSDGQDLAILTGVPVAHSRSMAHRVAFSGSGGHVVGITHFKGLLHAPGDRFFLNGNMALVRAGATKALGAEIGVFRYPAGKTPEQMIPTGHNLDFVFTLSVTPSD